MSGRLLGGSSTASYSDDRWHVDTDAGSIFRRLLLFDTYVLKSHRLGEVAAIVGAVGIDGAISLLRSGCLRVHLSRSTVAETGRTTILRSRAMKGALPLGSYSFSTINVPDREGYVSGCLQEFVQPIPGSLKEIQRLKRAVVDSLEPDDPEIAANTIAQLKADLAARTPVLKIAVANQLRRQHGISIDPSALSIALERIDESDFRSETNLEQAFNLDLEARHKIVGRATLDLAGLNQRIAEMRALDALSGFNVGDLPLFDSKVNFIVARFDPDHHEQRARRVVEVAAVPDFAEIGQGLSLDVDKFLGLRESSECREFRRWLEGVDRLTDAEIKDQTSALRARVAAATNSVTGKALRLLATTAAGLGPAGLLAGAAAGVLDSFVLDRLLKPSAIVTFVSEMYPAVFEHRD